MHTIKKRLKYILMTSLFISSSMACGVPTTEAQQPSSDTDKPNTITTKETISSDVNTESESPTSMIGEDLDTEISEDLDTEISEDLDTETEAEEDPTDFNDDDYDDDDDYYDDDDDDYYDDDDDYSNEESAEIEPRYFSEEILSLLGLQNKELKEIYESASRNTLKACDNFVKSYNEEFSFCGEDKNHKELVFDFCKPFRENYASYDCTDFFDNETQVHMCTNYGWKQNFGLDPYPNCTYVGPDFRGLNHSVCKRAEAAFKEMNRSCGGREAANAINFYCEDILSEDYYRQHDCRVEYTSHLNSHCEINEEGRRYMEIDDQTNGQDFCVTYIPQ